MISWRYMCPLSPYNPSGSVIKIIDWLRWHDNCGSGRDNYLRQLDDLTIIPVWSFNRNASTNRAEVSSLVLVLLPLLWQFYLLMDVREPWANYREVVPWNFFHFFHRLFGAKLSVVLKFLLFSAIRPLIVALRCVSVLCTQWDWFLCNPSGLNLTATYGLSFDVNRTSWLAEIDRELRLSRVIRPIGQSTSNCWTLCGAWRYKAPLENHSRLKTGLFAYFIQIPWFFLVKI